MKRQRAMYQMKEQDKTPEKQLNEVEIGNLPRDKEGHYIMIKGSIQEEGITIVNIYAPNIGAPQYIRQLLTAIKEEIDSDTIIVGDFNTSLTPMDSHPK